MSYLSYSKFEDYEVCPLRYKWKHVDKRPPTEPDKPLNKILGIVWNDALENFYNLKKYTLGSGCSAWLEEEIRRAFKYREVDLKVVWKGDQKDEYLRDAIAVIPLLIDTIKQEKLLGNVKIEEPMYADFPGGGRIGGRSDLILERENKTYILDFKGTKHKNGKYLSDKQLIWYGLLYESIHKRFPDYLGFWMLRFGCIRWAPVTKTKVESLIEQIKTAFLDIQAGKFQANPGWNACRFCQYQSGCDAWTKFKTESRKPSSLSEDGDSLSEVFSVGD